MNLPRDFEDRWQRIRKCSAICNQSKIEKYFKRNVFFCLDNRYDSKISNQMMSLHEVNMKRFSIYLIS